MEQLIDLAILAEVTSMTVVWTTVALAVICGVLASLIVVSDRYLNDYGTCVLDINSGDMKIETDGGKSVLDALGAEKIFIPSACGGRGTCLYCKLKVLEGGGTLGPAEKGGLTNAEKRDNVRLCCQVKIRGNMKLEIPEEYFKIKEYTCTVKSNKNVATFIKELILDMPPGEILPFEAGHYVQIHVPPFNIDYKDFKVAKKYHEDWDKFKIWDVSVKNDEEIQRAYSMANHPAEGNRVMLNVRIASPPPPHRVRTDDPEYPLIKDPKTGKMVPRGGIGSTYIFNLKEGDKVKISGPYGDFMIKDSDKEMIYVGGGAGMAPMRSHLFHLLDTLKTKRKVSYWYGARSVREIFYLEDFERLRKEHPNFSYTIALSDKLPEDDWDGPEGFIHSVLDDLYISKHENPKDVEYYLCGPPLMVNAVEDMLYKKYEVPVDMVAFDKF